jgi:hypothetical protein
MCREDSPALYPCLASVTRGVSLLAGDLLDQRLKGTPEVHHIVECLLRNGLRHGLGLSPILSKHDNPRVMVLHRQAPIVLGSFHFTHILARLHAGPRQMAGAREGLRAKLLRVAGAWPRASPAASITMATSTSTALGTRLDRLAGLSVHSKVGRMMHLLLIGLRDPKIGQSW